MTSFQSAVLRITTFAMFLLLNSDWQKPLPTTDGHKRGCTTEDQISGYIHVYSDIMHNE